MANDGLFATYVSETDTTAPELRSVAPSAGAMGVALDGNVEAGFSEAMDASMITDTTFTLTLDGTPVSATVSYDPTTRKATLNPNTALQAGKTYTAKIKGGSAGVKDSSGNPLNTDEVWEFTTVNPPPPTPRHLGSRARSPVCERHGSCPHGQRQGNLL